MLGIQMVHAKLVYLDQNKWIQIARVIHGKENDPMLRER